MEIRSLIIDDEPLAINLINNYLDKIEDIKVVSTFGNAIDALNFLKKEKVDLIFLDINMPLLDGLSFIKSLENKPLIIITSAHKEYAVETYELEVLDYLIKPIPFPRFILAINKVHKIFNTNKLPQKKTNSRPFIFIKIEKKKNIKIYLDEILVIESLRDYLKISTSTERYIIHQTHNSFTEMLPSESFIRIHRSYTVALDKIEVLEGNSVEVGGMRYVIGRSYIDDVKARILNSSIN
ncbi:LytR/AlgR family response regulator transcription factor [Polaribacter cellanae]|uniref:Response regulator transcription factor n=1 Tax=Polaribacter cellanae TaxID=2818493 RepID=A0A975H8Z0_9FLAO|nr:response regulator transcription factor [Polaribacter cellanae]QTE22200.1 response regulator transcription factor [Polaribacter cellanae]